jgi:hypothetical protein
MKSALAPCVLSNLICIYTHLHHIRRDLILLYILSFIVDILLYIHLIENL